MRRKILCLLLLVCLLLPSVSIQCDASRTYSYIQYTAFVNNVLAYQNAKIDNDFVLLMYNRSASVSFKIYVPANGTYTMSALLATSHGYGLLGGKFYAVAESGENVCWEKNTTWSNGNWVEADSTMYLTAGDHVITIFGTDVYGHLYIRGVWLECVQLDNTVVPVSSVSLNTDSITLSVGQNQQLVAHSFPALATYKGVTWYSSNESVATVNANGVVTAKSVGTVTITAKSNNGKSASCGITVMTPTTKLNYENFRYGFFNDAFDFGYNYYESNGRPVFNDYYIPMDRYMQLGFSQPKAWIKSKSKWGGSCFGMSMSSILFYKNVMWEERYGGTYPLDFDEPDSQTDSNEIKLREMIELLQISQDLKPNQPKFSASAVVRELNMGNPVKFGLKSPDGKHAVVIYGYTESNGGYIFDIYDCSGFVTHFIYLNDNAWQFVYDDNSWSRNYTWSPNNYCTYSSLKALHDEIKYGNNHNAASLFSLVDVPEQIYMVYPMTDVIVKNSNGNSLSIYDGEITNEIEGLNVTSSSYLSDNPIYDIVAPIDTYTIIGQHEEQCETSLTNDYMSVSVAAKGNNPITISEDLSKITLSDGGDFTIKYTTFDNIFDEIILTGTASGEVSATLDGTNVIVTGADTLEVAATVGGEEVKEEAKDLSQYESVSVVCEAGSSTTLQIIAGETKLTEKTTLPERTQVATPGYDLESGTYEEGQTLSFTKDDETIIYYTTDGSIPSEDNGMIYSLPIEVNQTMTIHAIATKYGFLDSDVVTLDYTLPTVEMPRANYESGEYKESIELSLTNGNAEDKIYYTLDGTNPFEYGRLYTVPIHLFEDTELMMYTVHNGCVSEVSEYSYTITHEKPFFFENTAINQENELITLDNVGDLTEVKVSVKKMMEGEQTGNFVVALYDESGKLVALSFKEDTILEENKTVTLPILGDVSTAVSMKVMVMDSNAKPIGNLQEQQFSSTVD